MKLSPLLLLPLALPVAAEQFQPLDSIHEAALAAARTVAPAGAELFTTPIDPRVRLPACGGALSGELAPATAMGSNLNVAVRCGAPAAWTLYVPVRVVHRQKVLVVRRGVRAGETLTADMVEAQPRDVAALAQGHLDDVAAAVGQRVLRALPAGAVLPPSALAPALLVRRGEQVTVLGQAGAIQVRSQGKALGDAALGQDVTVENVSSRLKIQGVVRAPGLVEVRL